MTTYLNWNAEIKTSCLCVLPQQVEIDIVKQKGGIVTGYVMAEVGFMRYARVRVTAPLSAIESK